VKNANSDDQTALARKSELIVKELSDEVLIYDLKSHKAHCLNETAAFVWNHCDGQTTASEIANLMEKQWRTPVREDVIWFTLNKLSRADLLKEQITLPEAHIGMSRRSAVRRLWLGSLLTVPVVMSIVAPTVLAAASVPVECQSCIKKATGIADCPAACLNIAGTCYGNSGCGAGQAKLGCQTCAACFSTAEATVSWEKPGVNVC
jgi:hypothetical protein